MKISNKKTLIVILIIILATLFAAYLFLSLNHRDTGMDTVNGDKTQPLPSDDMDSVYLYTDNQGMAHFSDQPPVGYDYQVVYMPKRTAVEKRDQLKLELADKAKKILRGEKVHGDPVKKPLNTGREFHRFPRTTAGDILSKSNELRQNAEKQGDHSR